MMTRTFLFLLAIMSGLTTAQAAERVRPVQSALGSGAVAAEVLVDALTEEKHKAASVALHLPQSRISDHDQHTAKLNAAAVPASPTVYIGDRNRQ
ncbi:hypothetical protein [Sphingorhabdus arenilitoris]